MARLASLAVDLKANTAKFTSQMAAAGGTVSKFRQRLALVRDLAIVTGLNLRRLSMMGRRVAFALKGILDEYGPLIEDSLNLANQLGTTTEALEGLRFAANNTGSAAATLDKGLVSMNRRLANAAEGGGKAAKAYEQLGLNARELLRMPLEERFVVLADAMERLPHQAQRNAMAFNVFGRSGASLVNTLNQGGDAIRGLMDDAKRMGHTFSSEEAQKVANYNGAMAALGDAIEGVKRRIAVELTPFVEDLATRFNNVTTAGKDMAMIVAGGIDRVVNKMKPLIVVFRAIQVALLSLRALFEGAFLAGTLGAGLLGKALSFLPGKLGDLGDKMMLNTLDNLDKIEERFANIGKGFKSAFSGLVNDSQNFADWVESVRAKEEDAGASIASRLAAVEQERIAAGERLREVLAGQRKEMEAQLRTADRVKWGPIAFLRGTGPRGGARVAPSEAVASARSELQSARQAERELRAQMETAENTRIIARNLKDGWAGGPVARAG
jgi:hypothetical protein